LAAATISIARVIWAVFRTERIRRRISRGVANAIPPNKRSIIAAPPVRIPAGRQIGSI
jgi:hypothetical protein